MKFYYHINIAERGNFRADVRDDQEKTVFEIRAGDELEEDEVSFFDEGWMKNYNDIKGLKEYLVYQNIMGKTDELYYVG